MPRFLIANRAPKGYRGSAQSFAAWNAWFERLGDSLLDRGNPVLDERSSLGNCGGDTELGGYTLITADDLEAATALAMGCPVLEEGGEVEIGKLTIVNEGRHLAK
jgi:hypothetical protein